MSDKLQRLVNLSCHCLFRINCCKFNKHRMDSLDTIYIIFWCVFVGIVAFICYCCRECIWGMLKGIRNIFTRPVEPESRSDSRNASTISNNVPTIEYSVPISSSMLEDYMADNARRQAETDRMIERGNEDLRQLQSQSEEYYKYLDRKREFGYR